MADRVKELIEKLGKSDRDVVKSSVVDDLGKIQDKRVIAPLIDALNDGEMLVRWNAIKGLSRFGESAVSRLLEALETKDRFKRRNIVQALGELGGDSAVDRMIRMLMFDESDKMVQIEIVRALDKIGDSRAVDPIITVLKMNDWEMRYRAIHALQHLADEKAVEPLLEVMNDPDKDIQWAAYMAIENIKSSALPGSGEEGVKTVSPAAAAKRKSNSKAEQCVLSAETQADGIVIYVDGELLYANIDGFMGYVEGVVSVGKGDVILDMKKCLFIDSFALSRLHALRKKLKAKGRNLILTKLKHNVMAVFAATKLDKVFEIR